MIVLWSVIMLSTVAATLSSAGRSDVQLVRNLRAAAQAQQAADGAVYRAAFHLTDKAQRWPADGRRIDVGGNGSSIGVCIRNEAGKINPNSASAGLMAALLRVLGTDQVTSQRVAEAIHDWHTPNDSGLALYRQAGLPYAPTGAPFGAVDDLRFVLGMTPALFERLRPYLSIWVQGDTDPRAASPAVRDALRALLGAEPPAAIEGISPHTVAITAVASNKDGGRFVRAAVLTLDGGPDPRPRVLDWSTGDTTECR